MRKMMFLPGSLVRLKNNELYAIVWKNINSFQSPKRFGQSFAMCVEKSSELKQQSTCLVITSESDVDTSAPAVLVLTGDLSIGWVNQDDLQCVK